MHVQHVLCCENALQVVEINQKNCFLFNIGVSLLLLIHLTIRICFFLTIAKEINSYILFKN